jgi:hypothetical protein
MESWAVLYRTLYSSDPVYISADGLFTMIMGVIDGLPHGQYYVYAAKKAPCLAGCRPLAKCRNCGRFRSWLMDNREYYVGYFVTEGCIGVYVVLEPISF